MLRPKKHISTKPIPLRNSTFYKKAIGVCELSRKLHENNHRTPLDIHEPRPYSSTLVEDVMVLSIKLPYTIALAQTTPNYQNRITALQALSESIKRLKNRCKQLDTMGTEPNTQIHSLRQELDLFSKLFKSWRLLLTRQN